jgi:hypothetical protein
VRRSIGIACLIGALGAAGALPAGCASGHPAARRTSTQLHVRPLRCPVTVTAPAGNDARPLRPDPRSAIACLANEPPQKRFPGNAVPRVTARNLARLVARAPTATAAQIARCRVSHRSVGTVIRFGYPDGGTQDLVERGPGCPGVFFVGSRGYVLPGVLGGFVFSMSMPGLSAASTPHHVVGEIVDARSGPGTVLLQAGTDVLVAVPPAAACAARELAVHYRAGDAGTGNDFGTVVLRNRATTWCALGGPIRIIGLDGAGRTVTQTATAAVAAPLVLSPDGTLAAEILMIAGYRDDPLAPNGLCDAHWIVPETWRLDLPDGVLAVPNAQGRVGRPIGSAGLVTCRGRFGAREARLETD